MDPKQIWQYELKADEQGHGWADIIIRQDGFFAAVSDYGNYAFAWGNHKCGDFRTFFIRVTNRNYFLEKLSKRLFDESYPADAEAFVDLVIPRLAKVIKDELEEAGRTVRKMDENER